MMYLCFTFFFLIFFIHFIYDTLPLKLFQANYYFSFFLYVMKSKCSVRSFIVDDACVLDAFLWKKRKHKKFVLLFIYKWKNIFLIAGVVESGWNLKKKIQEIREEMERVNNDAETTNFCNDFFKVIYFAIHQVLDITRFSIQRVLKN